MKEKKQMTPIQKGIIIAGIIFFIFGSAICIYSILTLDYMMEYSLGPGFLPTWCGAILAVLSIAVVIYGVRGTRSGSKNSLPVYEDLVVLGKLLLIVVGTVIFMKIVGMVASIAIYLLLTMKFVEKQPWKLSLLTALVGTLCIYLVFAVAFKVNFPVGILGF